MDKLILKLLKDNGRIIIPDFGALIVKQKSPFKVIFNEFLQYNDGALINSLAEQEGINKDEAAQKVKQLTKELESKLGSGQKITLDEIGTLARSTTGKITLSDSAENTPSTEATKPEVKEQSPKKEIEFEVQKEPAPKPEEKKKTEPKKPTIKEPIQEQKPIPKKEEVNIPKKEEVKREPQKAPEPKTTPTPAPTATETTTSKHNAPIQEYYQEGSKKNWKSILLWIFLILIVNGAIFGFFFFGDEIKAMFGKDKQEATTPEVEIFDEPFVDQDVAVDPESTLVSPEEDLVIEGQHDDLSESQIDAEPILPGTKYYVVAGVFREESNADNLVIKLKRKGYNSEKFGKIGQMHAVSYGVFPTKKEADNFMMRIKREVDPDAWIRIID